jgi:hypothetical protein
MLFVVTDGEWENSDECDRIIKRLTNKGVITSIVFMGDYGHINSMLESARSGEASSIEYLKRLRHDAKMFKAVANPKDVLTLAVDIVKSKVGK